MRVISLDEFKEMYPLNPNTDDYEIKLECPIYWYPRHPMYCPPNLLARGIKHAIKLRGE